MKVFPSSLIPRNKLKFEEYRHERILCYLRQEIYEHMLKNNEEDFFDLEGFAKKYDCPIENILEMQITVSDELAHLGWKTGLSYGNTALFIYSTENKPKSCWDSIVTANATASE